MSPRHVCFLTEFGDLERSGYGVLFYLGFTCGLAPGQPGSPVACGFPRQLPLAIRGAAGGRGSLALTWRPQEPTPGKGLPCCTGSPAESASSTHPSLHASLCFSPSLHRSTGWGRVPRCAHRRDPAAPGARLGCVERRRAKGRWHRGGQGEVAQRRPRPVLVCLSFPPRRLLFVSPSAPTVGDAIGVPSTPVWPRSSLTLPFAGPAPH